MTITYKTTRRHNPEDHSPNFHRRRENLKSREQPPSLYY
jgi:hypothetical protein